MTTTYHSIERTKERAGLRYNSAVKMIKKAMLCGICESNLPATERNYLQNKKKEKGYFIYYNGYIFVLSENDVCITMYKAPEWFLKKGNYDGKIKIKNKKQYYKNKEHFRQDTDDALWY